MKWTVPSFVLMLILSVPVYAFWGNSNLGFVFGNLAQIIGLVFAMSGYGNRISDASKSHATRRAWIQLTFGAFIWLLAQCLEIYCELVLNLIAYGTVADAIWVVGYVPIILGLHTLIKCRAKENGFPWRSRIKILIPGVLAYAILFLLLIWPQIRVFDQPAAEAILDFTYPTLDFVLVAQSVVLASLSGSGRTYFRFAVLSGIAFTMTLIGDGVLSLVKDFNSILYLSVDVYYFSCYFLMAISAEQESKQPATVVIL